MSLTADVLTWTDTVLDAFSDRRAILASHSLLCTGTQCPNYLAAEFSTQGQATYDALKHHTNLFLMHCGHAALTDMQPRRSDSYNGHTIHTLLANYQRGEDCPLWCGNGFLRIITFHPAEDRISVQTYSPWLDEYKTEPCFDGSDCQQFDLDYGMDGGIPFEAIGTVQDVTSGMTACLPWSGRQAGERIRVVRQGRQLHREQHFCKVDLRQRRPVRDRAGLQRSGRLYDRRLQRRHLQQRAGSELLRRRRRLR